MEPAHRLQPIQLSDSLNLNQLLTNHLSRSVPPPATAPLSLATTSQKISQNHSFVPSQLLRPPLLFWSPWPTFFFFFCIYGQPGSAKAGFRILFQLVVALFFPSSQPIGNPTESFGLYPAPTRRKVSPYPDPARRKVSLSGRLLQKKKSIFVPGKALVAALASPGIPVAILLL